MTHDTFEHFHFAPRRKAEFITPPNTLKTKVGSGGLDVEILNKAQALIENHTEDFKPIAEMYLEAVMRGIEYIKTLPNSETKDENAIAAILFPTMQLKANGGMFHYDLVTKISDRLVQFLEVIEYINADSLEIIQAFHTTIRAVLLGQIKGDGGPRGQELFDALNDACYRFLEKYPQKKPS